MPSAGYTHYAFSMNPGNFDQAIKKISDSSAVIFKENTSPGDSLYFFSTPMGTSSKFTSVIGARVL